MTPYYANDQMALYHGDALDVLRGLDDASVDAVVTDPPYGLEFMGREWDGADGFRRSLNPADADRDSVFGRAPRTSPEYRAGALYGAWCQAWAVECLRVLKPGGHLLAFGGTRTYHRLTCAVEDAGFEIRDEIAWIYGSGFPKSLDVSKAIDKANGNPLAFREFARAYAAAVDASELTHADVDRHLGIKASSCYWAREDHRGGMPPRPHWERVRGLLSLPAEFERLYDEAEREVIGERVTGIGTGRGSVAYIGDSDDRSITAPATDDARRWSGWGTALKPAHEPIVVARKPLAGTVAANVLTYGTGALNVDATRVECAGRPLRVHQGRSDEGTLYGAGHDGSRAVGTTDAGRWPSNVVLDEAAAAELDRQSGTLTSGANPTRRASDKFRDVYDTFPGHECMPARGADSGGASRFFPVFRYEAKAPTHERPRVDGEAHETVKPLDLMRWLVRLVTPPTGLVLDPFAGSGTTAEACVIEGFRCVAVEQKAKYLPLIVARLSKPIQLVLEAP